ncbi:MAG: helix-turn-helix domain-containing protein [Methylobacter sp.]
MQAIAQGLNEVIALNEGKDFAAKFCINIGTLRHWERGDRKPHGPASALLHVVAKEPQAVLRALG